MDHTPFEGICFQMVNVSTNIHIGLKEENHTYVKEIDEDIKEVPDKIYIHYSYHHYSFSNWGKKRIYGNRQRYIGKK